MRYFNIVLSASLMLLLSILSVAPALTAADTFAPYKISLGPDGNIYTLASGNASVANYIFVFTHDGRLVKTLDRQVLNLAFDDVGNLYIQEVANGRNHSVDITRLDKSGNETVLWSNSNQSYLTVADMTVSPGGVVYFSTLYVDQNQSVQAGNSSYSRSDVYAIDASRTPRVIYAKNITAASGGFDTLAVDRNGILYGAGISNQITVISPDGTTKTIGKQGSENGTFNWIYDVAIGQDGYLYVAELGNRRVQKLTTDGTFVAKWNGCGPDPFDTLCGLAIDENGRVYVADMVNRRIVWFAPDYTFGTDRNENLKGQGVMWGNIYAGTNYTTQQMERRLKEQQNLSKTGMEATPEPGFSSLMALLCVVMSGMALYLYRSKVK